MSCSRICDDKKSEWYKQDDCAKCPGQESGKPNGKGQAYCANCDDYHFRDVWPHEPFIGNTSNNRYITSDNHHILFSRIMSQNQRIVCFVDYGSNECRDIAMAKMIPPDTLQISVRGMVYIHATDKFSFLKQCAELNVEFIDPFVKFSGGE